MNRAEIAQLLGLAAARDRRTVGTADVAAWFEDLGDLDFVDARTAISRHFRETTDWLMPAHIRRHVAAIVRDRKRAQREHAEQLAIETERADPTRQDRSAAVSDVISRLRAILPDGHPDKLRRPEWVEWERNQARAARAAAEPNPHYDPAVTVAALLAIAEAEENPA